MTVMAATLVVVSGVALAVVRSGGPGDDTLRGTNGPDVLYGNGGDDLLEGLRGRDTLSGGPGRDAVLGGNEFGPQSGDRNLSGGPGGDFVGAGRGSDVMAGGSGRDLLFDAEFTEGQRDVISGGDGDDAIITWQRPAAKDVIDCGSGFDAVLVDSEDVVAPNCERVFTRPGRFFRFLENSNYNYFEPLERTNLRQAGPSRG